MPRSNYGRFKDGVQLSGISLNVHQKGKVFYVGNSTAVAPLGIGASDGNNGLTPEQPLSTLDAAVGMCTANRGDKIIVLPGHAETIATATALALDVAGIHIIGNGEGALMPAFSLSATTSTIAVSAANVKVQGIAVIAAIDSVVAGFTISAAGVELDLETRDTSAAIEFISAVVTTADADNLKLTLRHRGFAAGDAMTRYIDMVGCTDALVALDFFGIASVAVLNMRTTACDNIRVTGNFYNESVALTKNVVNSTTSTWSVEGFDAKAGFPFAGSDDKTVALMDTGTLEEILALPRAVASAAKVLTTGNVNMFTVSGGPIEVISLVGIVTTVVQAQATSTKVTVTTTSPAATVDFSAAAVDLTGAAAGSSIRHINTTNILTVVAAGYVMGGAAFATNQPKVLVPAGTIQVNNASASNTGAITWYLHYVPLSPLSRVA